MDYFRHRVKPLGSLIDIRGKLVQLYGVSFADSREFFYELEYLHKLVANADSSNKSFDELLADSGTGIRATVERLLELNGLHFRQLSLRHIQELLWVRLGEDEIGEPKLLPGLLIEINTPRTTDETAAELGGNEDEDASYERVLAILAEHTGSLNEAIDLTQRLRTDQIRTFLEQKADLASKGDRPKLSKANQADLLAALDSTTGIMPTDDVAKEAKVNV